MGPSPYKIIIFLFGKPSNRPASPPKGSWLASPGKQALVVGLGTPAWQRAINKRFRQPRKSHQINCAQNTRFQQFPQQTIAAFGTLASPPIFFVCSLPSSTLWGRLSHGKCCGSFLACAFPAPSPRCLFGLAAYILLPLRPSGLSLSRA
jgi:hypothetical protein